MKSEKLWIMTAIGCLDSQAGKYSLKNKTSTIIK